MVFIGDGLAITLGNKLSEVAPAAIPFRLVDRNFFRLIIGLWVGCGLKHSLKTLVSLNFVYAWSMTTGSTVKG